MTRDQADFLDRQHRSNYRYLRSYLFRSLGDEDRAEDLVQQSFLIACRKIEDVYIHPNPAGWFYLTVRFLLLREQERLFNKMEEPLENPDLLPAGPDKLTFDQILPSGLAPKDREIILLKYQKGLTHEEIAELYGISVQASKQRLSRAIRSCRKLLTS